MDERTALIVGAGIGGLAAAIALEQAGFRVRVFERAASPREVGFALNLAPNAVAALRELGVDREVIATGHALADIELRHADGRVLSRLNLETTIGRTPTVMALRPALHSALAGATKPGTLVLGCDASGFEVNETRVVLHCRDGRSEPGGLLIGADGVGSVVRRQLHPKEPAPRRSPYLAVRGVAYHADHHLGSLDGVAYFGRGLEAAGVRAGSQAVYWYLSLLADDVGRERRAPSVAARYAGVIGGGFQAIVGATRDEDMRLDELFDRDPIDEWGRGPVTLLGDAAHPMLPHAGQGAAQALEDAVALGLALTHAGDLGVALRRYERVRAARTRRVVRQARLAARVMTTGSRAVDWLRAMGLRVLPAGLLARAYLRADGDPHAPLRSAR